LALKILELAEKLAVKQLKQVVKLDRFVSQYRLLERLSKLKFLKVEKFSKGKPGQNLYQIIVKDTEDKSRYLAFVVQIPS